MSIVCCLHANKSPQSIKTMSSTFDTTDSIELSLLPPSHEIYRRKMCSNTTLMQTPYLDRVCWPPGLRIILNSLSWSSSFDSLLESHEKIHRSLWNSAYTNKHWVQVPSMWPLPVTTSLRKRNFAFRDFRVPAYEPNLTPWIPKLWNRA
jgi:hypothetical protein